MFLDSFCGECEHQGSGVEHGTDLDTGCSAPRDPFPPGSKERIECRRSESEKRSPIRSMTWQLAGIDLNFNKCQANMRRLFCPMDWIEFSGRMGTGYKHTSHPFRVIWTLTGAIRPLQGHAFGKVHKDRSQAILWIHSR